MRSIRPARTRGSRRGNVAHITAGAILVVLGFGALSIDLGLVRTAGVQIQTGVDAAALGGSGYLDGTNLGATTAKTQTQVIGNLNSWYKGNLALTPGDVEVGVYTEGLGFVPIADPGAFAFPQAMNAVRVQHTSASFPAVFASVAFGKSSFTESATALAVRPTGGTVKSNCWLPLAIPDCHLDDTPEGTNPTPFMFEFTNSNVDTVAWGDPTGNPNSSGIRSQLSGQCDGPPLEVGDPMYVNEGQHNSALIRLAAILNGMHAITPSSWPSADVGALPARDGITANLPGDSAVLPAAWGNTVQGPVALVDAGSCDSLSFTGSMEITGFTWAILYDLKALGSPKNIWVQLDFTTEHEVDGDIGDGLSTTISKGQPVLFPE